MPFNVLHVISDQHLATCLGAEGHPQAITPNMDRLAREGVRFTHAYTQNPICTPSRTCILSGQYCHNHGYYGLSGPHPGGLPSFLHHFKKLGYATAGIGKLHTPNDPRDWLLDACDHYAESYDYGMDPPYQSKFFRDLAKVGLLDREDSIRLPELPGLQQHEGRPSELPYEHSVEGWCVREAVEFMGRARAQSRPFCMQVSLPRPHQCYTPDRRFWDMYPADLALPPTIKQDASHRAPHFRATVEGYSKAMGQFEPRGFENVSRRVWRAYLACVTQVDFALGQLLDYLDHAGLADRTIVVYHSDHGAYTGTHGIPEKAPGICSEAVCRVPMIWRFPGVTRAGHVSDALVENIDLPATFTTLAGVEPMDTIDGADLTPLLRGGGEPVRQVAVTENPWSKAIRFDRWRLVHYQPEMFPGAGDVGELYDIDADPNETRNLYADPAHRDTLERGRRLLLEWLIRTTRIRTMHPPYRAKPAPYDFHPAADGKYRTGSGPADAAKRGWLHYL